MERRIILICLSFCITAVFSSCRDGFIHHASKCYHFSHDAESFLAAQVICQHFGGGLIEVDSPTESAYIAQQVKLRNDGFYWIGLADILEQNTWRWYSTDKLANYTNWATGQPNNNGLEFCVALSTAGKWHDARCSSAFHYICKANDDAQSAIIG